MLSAVRDRYERQGYVVRWGKHLLYLGKDSSAMHGFVQHRFKLVRVYQTKGLEDILK